MTTRGIHFSHVALHVGDEQDDPKQEETLQGPIKIVGERLSRSLVKVSKGSRFDLQRFREEVSECGWETILQTTFSN